MRGRPKKAVAKEVKKTFRYTEREWELVEYNAKIYGMTPTAYVRWIGQQKPNSNKIEERAASIILENDREVLQRIYAELDRQNRFANQILKCKQVKDSNIHKTQLHIDKIKLLSNRVKWIAQRLNDGHS